MLINSIHSYAERGADAYFTPPEAVRALVRIESVPYRVWEPACGNGAISMELQAAGHDVRSSDLYDYGWSEAQIGIDYLVAAYPAGVGAIVTNPPYRLAVQFAEKAIAEAPYVALLLRLNFLESTRRLPFFRQYPPARIWISSRRLPMMHRQGWNGPRAGSNVCYAWFVWEGNVGRPALDWFDWKERL